MIDTMFLQEIRNAEVIRRRCCRSCKNCCEPTLVDPENQSFHSTTNRSI